MEKESFFYWKYTTGKMNIDLNNIPIATAELLVKFADLIFIQKFTLVGGTALSLQIGHRQSEDLDFIYDGEKIPTTILKREISKKFPTYKLIREERDYQLDFLIEQVKVTFFSSGAVLIPFRVMNFSEKYRKINIANINIIAVLKMATLAQQNTIRDYYDLYFISKHILPLNEIIEQSKVMLPNISAITYTETIIYTDDIPENSIENYLNPKELVTKEEISVFFIEELKKLRTWIKPSV